MNQPKQRLLKLVNLVINSQRLLFCISLLSTSIFLLVYSFCIHIDGVYDDDLGQVICTFEYASSFLSSYRTVYTFSLLFQVDNSYFV